MRVSIRSSSLLVIAAALAACGSAAAPTGSKPSGTRPALASHGPPAGSRPQAAALANVMLARLRLPAGAVRLPPNPLPPLLMGGAVFVVGASASLDMYHLFKLHATMDGAISALAADVPRGMYLTETGPGSGPNGATGNVTYFLRAVPPGIESAELVVTVASDKAGGSLARADVQVIWYPPRSAAEHIDPARYRALTIVVRPMTAQNPIRGVFTSQTAIRQAADVLNQSQTEPPIRINCPLGLAIYELMFAATRQGTPLVVVTFLNPACAGAQITVDGRQQPQLQGSQAMIAIADKLLGFTPRS